MQRHIKIYLNHYGYGMDDRIACEVCDSIAVDIHHIKFRSQGGGDDIENLIALCRECHTKAHNSKEFNQKLHDRKRTS